MNRDYEYLEATSSICPECRDTVQSKIIIKEGKVFILKYCKEHGEMMELLEDNAEYHLNKRRYDKPGTAMKVYTDVKKSCPFDCGTCPQHDQHACIGLIEVTGKCNLNCPLCYASSGKGDYVPLSRIEKMIDFLIDSEFGKAEILQISGGEPTLHPEILNIIKLAKSKNLKYVMLNTNGLRIAEDEAFVKKLSEFKGGFEVYLQFDGFKSSTYEALRGKNILPVKLKAIENLSKYKIPTTLVSTVAKGINDDELGEIFSFGLKTPYVRGINLQPAAFFGRISKEATQNRMTLTGVIECLSKQSGGTLRFSDFIPLPCNVERVSLTYLYKNSKGGFVPITRDANIQNYLHMINNTFVFTIEDALKNAGGSIKDIDTTCDCLNFLRDFRKIVPANFFLRPKEAKMKYVDENTFRISISSFLDAYNFDLKSMQKECVHIVTEDLRKIPFSSYNMFYRGGEKRD